MLIVLLFSITLCVHLNVYVRLCTKKKSLTFIIKTKESLHSALKVKYGKDYYHFNTCILLESMEYY